MKGVTDVIKKRGFNGSMGVVTPFRSQANLIESGLRKRLDDSEMRRCEFISDTAHRFQGDEKEMMFFSPCVTDQMPQGADWFLCTNGHLFNVAITRARAILVVMGNLAACRASDIPHVKGFAEFYEQSLHDESASSATGGFKDGPSVGHLERPFYDAMVAAGLNPIHQYREGPYVLDFAFITEAKKLNVEVDGEMYHQEWDGTRSMRDLMRDHRLIGMGWEIKRFWVHELRDDMDRCVAEVKAVLR